MEKFEVTILGCGSALPTTRHNGSSQIVNVREKLFVVDCAEGTQLEMRRRSVRFSRIFCIFLSHLHGDHCFGLTGLISTLGLLGRTAPLHIYGPADTEAVFRPQIDYFCKGLEFEVVFHAVDTRAPQTVYDDRSLTVTTIPLSHRIDCCGYLFREKPGLRHLRPDALVRYNIPREQYGNLKAGLDFVAPDGHVVANDLLTLPPDPPRAYAYMSDTRYLPAAAEQVSHVNLLYHEATFLETEKRMAARYFHSTARQAATFAASAQVGQLAIGHFSARYTDEAALLNEATEVFPNTVLTCEGLTLKVE